MSFVSPTFLVLLAVTRILWALTGPVGRRGLLVATGLLFYGWIAPWLVALLLVSAALDFVLARRIEDAPEHARRWVGLSVLGNLALLGTFKYADFFVTEIATAISSLGLHADPWLLGLVVPPGLSFYTFQTLGYTLDVRARRVRAERDPTTFLAFVAFFPQLVVGPIERATDLLPQVRTPPTPTADDTRAGLDLLLWGAVQKVVIADPVGAWVDRCFAAEPHALLLAAGTLGFMVQILADFRGYTHMARGAARLLGIRLTPNFHFPWLATGPSDFWQRWHATLTRWMMDHAFGPLGGTRHPVRATLAVMLLVGLWHGAAWTFVAFGVIHGVALVLWRPLTRAVPAVRQPLVGWALWTPIVVSSLAVFRAPSLTWLAEHTTGPAWLDAPTVRALAGATLSTTAAGALLLTAAMLAQVRIAPLLRDRVPSDPVRIVGWTAAGLAIATFATTEPAPFVYWAF